MWMPANAVNAVNNDGDDANANANAGAGAVTGAVINKTRV